MSRILHILSINPVIQGKVREEVRSTLRSRRAEGDLSGRLSYDEIMALPWLDAVIKETLRL